MFVFNEPRVHQVIVPDISYRSREFVALFRARSSLATAQQCSRKFAYLRSRMTQFFAEAWCVVLHDVVVVRDVRPTEEVTGDATAMSTSENRSRPF